MKSLVLAVSMAVVLMASSSALAQGYYATYMPVGPAPVVGYYAPAPVMSYGPVVATSYYAPVPYYAASPVRYYVAAPVPVARSRSVRRGRSSVLRSARDRSPQDLLSWTAGAQRAAGGDPLTVS